MYRCKNLGRLRGLVNMGIIKIYNNINTNYSLFYIWGIRIKKFDHIFKHVEILLPLVRVNDIEVERVKEKNW